MGQCCTVGSRPFAHKRVFDRPMKGIAAEASKESGRKESARVIAGGERVGNAGYFVAPTVLTDVGCTQRNIRPRCMCNAIR